MKICLVSPPTITEFEGTPTSRAGKIRRIAGWPTLGVLSLAAVLEASGHEVEIVDLNRLFCDFAEGEDGSQPGGFFDRAVGELLQSAAGVFGFSTICNTYPLTVRLAREIKRARPDAAVIFGGPQASATDIATLAALPFVDIIVRGEAEESFPQLLDALDLPERLACIPGITWRRDGSPTATPGAPLPDLGNLPVPAYHLWPHIRALEVLPVEAGRGCPFSCTFCSTSRYFHRRYRLKSPKRIIEEMMFLHREYGVEKLHLTHDAFTVDRAKVIDFCRALLDADTGLGWSCSARTDCVDEELLSLMAEAGCTAVFFGIETGSPRVQRAIRKGLDLDQALTAIQAADRHSIKPTVSLITGFPEETSEDLQATLRFLMDAVRVDSVEPQLHLVAPLAGSELYEQYRGRLQWDGIFSDMAFQSWSQDPNDRELIIRHPEVFPDYLALPTPLDRRFLMDLRHFVTYSLSRFRWLTIALEQQSGNLLGVYGRWRERRPSDADGQYYAGPEFRRDFLDFAATADGAPGVATLLDFESKSQQAAERETAEPARSPGTGLDFVPYPAPGVAVLTVQGDYHAVIDCLRDRTFPGGVSRAPVTLARVESPGRGVDVVRLTPLAAALMKLCDGTRTAREIIAVFPTLDAGLDTFPAEPACLFALNQLAEQHLLVFSVAEPVAHP